MIMSAANSSISSPDTGAAASSSLTLFSPSKINVFLRIIRRREDGFHELASLFHVIDCGDELVVDLGPPGQKDTLKCNMTNVPVDSSNLVLKALAMFRERALADIPAAERPSYHCTLRKRVPAGAGLGGGSGNAATALFAANVLAGNPASESDLQTWSADIGSDCPVYFGKGASYVTGRGEFVDDVESPFTDDDSLLLVKPPIELSTGRIFKALDLNNLSDADPKALMSQIADVGAQATVDLTVNDLEAPAFKVLPRLRELKERLAEADGGCTSFMSGSGSTIVALGVDTPPTELIARSPSLASDWGTFDPEEDKLFISRARFITRKEGEWFKPSKALAEEHANAIKEL